MIKRSRAHFYKQVNDEKRIDKESLENLANKAPSFVLGVWDHHIMDRDIVQARQKLMRAAR